LPDALGVAGPFVGVHNDALIVAGGANFPKPVWESKKVWHDRIHVLARSESGYTWQDGGRLPRPLAYGAAVSTPQGVICLGGNDSTQTFRDVFAMRWDPATRTVTREEYPQLPQPCAYGQAALMGKVLYLAGGQSDLGLDSALNNFWSLDLSQLEGDGASAWRVREPWPGQRRALNITVALQGTDAGVFVISGRTQNGEEVQFLKDAWKFQPATESWKRCADLPRCVMAGTAVPIESGKILVLGGDDGSLFFQADALRDNHPGFPREGFSYEPARDVWASIGPLPHNQVTTIPAMWDGRVIIACGEIRPRVRTPAVWSGVPGDR
jgi:N-acetylneuraminic acid mutarotase